MDTLNIVILGAGRTGRGFIARLLHKDARLIFIDSDLALVRRLNEAGAYVVRYFDGAPERIIGGYVAYHTDDPACRAAIEASAAVFVSVRGENTGAAGVWLAERGCPPCIVVCENAVDPAALLGGSLSGTAASAAVFCTTVEDGPLDIYSERYPQLHVSAHGLSADIAALDGIAVEDSFDVLMRRKIYTYNAASCIIAYLGALRGIESYADAANDPDIAAELDLFYVAINAAICAEFGIEGDRQRVFAAMSKEKFQNRAIADSVARNAASPARKLSPEERIIASARLIARHGGDTGPLTKTAAAALVYMGVKTQKEAGDALTQICMLGAEDPLYHGIMDEFIAIV